MGQRRIWVHVLWWIGIWLVWITVFQTRAFTFSRTVTVQLCYLVFIAANYYLSIYVTVPRLLYRKKYMAFGSALIGGILVSALLRVPLAMYLNAHYFAPGGVQPAGSVPQ